MKVFKKQFDTSLAFVDLLNYGVMLTPTIMLGKDGSLTGGCTYSCWDYENSDNAELNDLTATLNSAFLRLGSEYTIHFHANRKETAEYPSAEESHFSSLLTALIDEERRLKFERSGLHFETQLAFTISYTPDTIAKAKLVDLFVSNESSTSHEFRTQLIWVR